MLTGGLISSGLKLRSVVSGPDGRASGGGSFPDCSISRAACTAARIWLAVAFCPFATVASRIFCCS